MMSKTLFKSFTKFTICTALALAPCGFSVPVQAALSQADETEKTIAVLPFETLGTGNESGCAKRALFAVNDVAEWQRVWGVHTQGIAEAQSLPKIDFSRQTVIAVLSGERDDEKSLQIAQVVRGPQETVVYFMLSDAKSWLGLDEISVKTQAEKAARPYVFVAVDKVTTPLRFADVFAAPSSCSKCAG